MTTVARIGLEWLQNFLPRDTQRVSSNCVSFRMVENSFMFYLNKKSTYSREGERRQNLSFQLHSTYQHKRSWRREIVRWTTQFENIVALASTCFTFESVLVVASAACPLWASLYLYKVSCFCVQLTSSIRFGFSAPNFGCALAHFSCT